MKLNWMLAIGLLFVPLTICTYIGLGHIHKYSYSGCIKCSGEQAMQMANEYPDSVEITKDGESYYLVVYHFMSSHEEKFGLKGQNDLDFRPVAILPGVICVVLLIIGLDMLVTDRKR